MSLKFLNAAFSTVLDPSTKIVLLALSDQANDKGICWPSQAHIAVRCSMSDRTIRRHIRKLENQGMVKTVAKRRRDGRNGSSEYHLFIDKIEGNIPADNMTDGEDENDHECPPGQRSALSAPLIVITEPSENNNNKNLFNEEEIPAISHSDRFQQIWNNHAKIIPSWPLVKGLPNTRKQAINARIKEWGEEQFFQVVENAINSEFFCAEAEKKSRWFKPDWILGPKNFTKALEGNYHEKLRIHKTAEDENEIFWRRISRMIRHESGWPDLYGMEFPSSLLKAIAPRQVPEFGDMPEKYHDGIDKPILERL